MPQPRRCTQKTQTGRECLTPPGPDGLCSLHRFHARKKASAPPPPAPAREPDATKPAAA